MESQLSHSEYTKDVEPAPEIINLFTNESIKTADVPPGAGSDPRLQSDPSSIYKEWAMERLSRYVKPHKVLSRTVTNDDIERVIKDGTIMVELCNIKNGVYPGGFALHHSQIEDKDPLSFFCLHNGETIINPEIINHTKQKIEKEEACLSFPAELPIKVIRYHKVTVKFQTLIPKEGSELPILSEVVEQGFSGQIAEIFLHEVDHGNGISIYDEKLDN